MIRRGWERGINYEVMLMGDLRGDIEIYLSC